MLHIVRCFWKCSKSNPQFIPPFSPLFISGPKRKLADQISIGQKKATRGAWVRPCRENAGRARATTVGLNEVGHMHRPIPRLIVFLFPRAGAPSQARRVPPPFSRQLLTRVRHVGASHARIEHRFTLPPGKDASDRDARHAGVRCVPQGFCLIPVPVCLVVITAKLCIQTIRDTAPFS